MSARGSYYPWTVSRLAVEEHHDLLTFLAAAQRCEVDMLPITWQQDQSFIGSGGTADLSQTRVDMYTSLAFKRMRPGQGDETLKRENFKNLTSELLVYKYPPIIDHPNIVQLEGFCWEVGSDDNELLPVLVFTKAELGDLQNFMQTEAGHKKSFSEKIQWCLALVDALKVLHDNDIVHGDLKPSNVLVFEENERIMVKISDLGYSVMGEKDTFLPNSWPWTAPEWTKRRFDIPNAKKMDVYSFGLLCFWLMFSDVQEKPVMAKELSVPFCIPDETADPETVKLVRSHDILPQFARSVIANVNETNEEQKKRLSLFFERTVRTSPEHRTLGLTELAQLLDPQYQHLSSHTDTISNPHVEDSSVPNFEISASINQLVPAVPEVRRAVVRTLEQNAIECRQHLHSFDCLDMRNAAFQLAVCYQLGFGVAKDENTAQHWLKKSQQEPDRITRTIDNIRHGTSLAAFHGGLFRKLYDEGHVSRFEHSDFHRRRKNLLESVGLYQQEITDLAESLGENHSTVMVIRSNLALIYMDEGDLTKAIELEEKVLDSAMGTVGTDDHFSIMAKANLASMYSHQGKWKTAESMYRELLDQCQRVLGAKHPSTIAAMANLSTALRLQGRLEEAEEIELKMVDLQQSVFGKEHPDTLSAKLNLAATFRAGGKHKDSAEIEEKVVQISRSTLDEGNLIIIRAESNLALSYEGLGRLGDAAKLHERIEKVCIKFLSPSHPTAMANLHNFARVLTAQGDYEKAEDILRSVLEIQTVALGENHPDPLRSIAELASNLSQQGHLFDAERMLTGVLEKMEKGFGKDNPMTLTTKSKAGELNLKLGRYEVAKDMLQEVLDTQCRLVGKDHPSALTTKQNLAVAQTSLKSYEEAIKLLVDVVKSRTQMLGPDAMPTLVAMSNLTSVLRQQGKDEDALQTITDIVERMTRTLGPDHPHTITSMSIRCNVLVDNRSFQQADEAFRQIIPVKEQKFGVEHPETLSTKTSYATCCFGQGRIDEGAQILRSVYLIRSRVLGPDHPDTKSVAELVAVLEEEESKVASRQGPS